MTNKKETLECRVCLYDRAVYFNNVNEKDYWKCPKCSAIFLESSYLPDVNTERSEYLLHDNDPADPGYRTFLTKLSEPLLEKLRPSMKGLDYGCGQGPALAAMLIEKGYDVSLYDPFFYPDTSVLNRTYDFIICSEVVEHFHKPAYEFGRLDALLNLDGWLAIMTCFQTDDAKFANWHYRRDQTHVVFYRKETFEHIAWQYGWKCQVPAKDVVLMQRNDPLAPLCRRRNPVKGY